MTAIKARRRCATCRMSPWWPTTWMSCMATIISASRLISRKRAPAWRRRFGPVSWRSSTSRRPPNGQPRVGFANPALYAIGKSTNYDSVLSRHLLPATTSLPAVPQIQRDHRLRPLHRLGDASGIPSDPGAAGPARGKPRHHSSRWVSLPAEPGGGPFSVDFPNLYAEQYRPEPLNLEPRQHLTLAHRFRDRRTLDPGGAAATVTVSLNSTANNFLIAHYSGNVSFANLTDGTAPEPAV